MILTYLFKCLSISFKDRLVANKIT